MYTITRQAKKIIRHIRLDDHFQLILPAIKRSVLCTQWTKWLASGQCWPNAVYSLSDCSRFHVMKRQEDVVWIQITGSGLHEVTLTDHDLCQKVDDGVRRLVRVHLREDVARISCRAAKLPCNESEHPIHTSHVIRLWFASHKILA